MSTHALDGTRRPVDLGDGYTLIAPGVHGTTESTTVRPGTRTREFAEALFDAQLESAGLTKVREIGLDVIGVAAPPAGARVLGEPEAAAVLEVPSDIDEGAVVLMEDESGALTWHVPDASRGGAARALTPGQPGVLTFTFPVAASPDGARGFGGIGKKLIKVFKYPIEKVEEGIGKIAAGFVRRWEAKHRPYLLCTYDASSYATKRHDQFALAASDWRRLAEGRALLFVHGTFSSCDAFSDLPEGLMAELSSRYDGRLFAFDHPTMADDPAENAEHFLSKIPPGTVLTLDVVCHSRGGLVAREIAARGLARGVTVGRIVMAGVPNGGTPLADKEHLLGMVDRLTNVANLFPSRVATVVLDALVAVVKSAAHALLGEMDGLRAMDPDQAYLKGLNAGAASGATLHAIVSNFEPKAGTPLFSLTRAADAGADRVVFGGAANDLVVPTLGGHTVGAAGFPVAEERRFEFAPAAGVIHTNFFAQAETQERIREWLAPAAPRDLAIAAARGMSDADLDALRPHLINITDGQLSRRGRLATTQQDVQALFGTTIPQWIAAQPAGAPARVVFWAHGGLINEKDGIAIAAKHVAWWKSNGVFPVYFVWETGLFDAIAGLLANAGRAARGTGARGFTDVSDLLVERTCRALRGDLVWGAMKSNAERASETGGGGDIVAEQLAKFAGAHPHVELHAVGHSAGSIFHAHWLNAAKGRGVPGFRTLQLLAPAIRIDEFRRHVEPLLGGYVQHLAMFSMTDDLERADSCVGVYRKSLLYLIHKALERREGEPILGLRVSTENDAATRALFFGDGNGAGPRAAAVWSVTSETRGPSASASKSHGGFDDDGPTMTSVALRLLSPGAAPDAATAAAVRPYVGDARRGREFPISAEVRLGLDGASREPRLAAIGTRGRPRIAPSAGIGGGRRRALCIGIDAYAAPHTLGGCVNDARAWGALLEDTFDFEVSYLVNERATRDGMVRELGRLIRESRAGDTLVLQYSGHGTYVPDVDGDEPDGTDEALVPFDWEQSQFLIDDDVRELLSKIPDGVSLTAFMDCCHSGTNTRVFDAPGVPTSSRARVRFLSLARRPDVVQRYRELRQTQAGARGDAPSLGDRASMRWVTFSACQPDKQAFEEDGNGDFTRFATELLAGGIDGVSNLDFQRRLLARFGAAPRQRPYLDCPPEAEGASVLHFAAEGRVSNGHRVDGPAWDAEVVADAAVVGGDVRAEDQGALDRRRAGDRRAEARPDSPGRRAADVEDNILKLEEVAEWILANRSGQP